VDDLEAEAHPMTHDMCADHSDRLRAPNQWTIVDRRSPVHLRAVHPIRLSA
jgi:hypothetical protein